MSVSVEPAISTTALSAKEAALFSGVSICGGLALPVDGLPRSRGIEGDEEDAVAFRIAAAATGDPGHELDHQPVSEPTWPPRGSKAATAAI
ncbi:hypothetical protein ACFPOB_15390 [Bosea eneae]|uniref:Uncharacterized protein n=1 Tax=Bosea eneae TaxID=151454 RepID=A0ABW0IYN8_9HYPH